MKKVIFQETNKGELSSVISSEAFVVEEELYRVMKDFLLSKLTKDVSEKEGKTLEDTSVVRSRKINYSVKTIRTLIEDGKNDGEISKLLKIPYASLHNFIKKHRLREMSYEEYLEFLKA